MSLFITQNRKNEESLSCKATRLSCDCTYCRIVTKIPYCYTEVKQGVLIKRITTTFCRIDRVKMTTLISVK